MLKTKQASGMKKGALIALFFIAWLVYGCLNISVSSAADAYAYKKDSLRKGNTPLAAAIYSGDPVGAGDVNGYKDATSIGFDTLYGTSMRDNVYTGDVPGANDNYKDYPHFASEWLGDRYRAWWKDPKTVEKDLLWEDSGTDDIHAEPLTQPTNLLDGFFRGLAGITFSVIGILNFPFALILRMIINIGNFDVSSVASMLNLGDLAKTISSTFTMDAAGNISPLLVIALAIFMVGLAGLIGKRIFAGNASKSGIWQEIVILLISFVLIAVGYTGGYGTLISLTGNATTTLVSQINSSSGEHMQLFQYNTGNATADANATDIGMTAKTYIDIVIRSQFGYSTDELDLWGTGDASQKNWSISEADMKELVRNLTKHDNYGGDENLFCVSTGGYTNTERPNVGYWWYAVDSGVNPSNPFYKDENGNIITNRIDIRQGMFVVDLMSAIHAKAPAGSVGANKSLEIIKSFYNHNWDTGGLFLSFLVTLALCFALFLLSVFSLLFKLIFNVGFVLIPVIPILLLIPQTRDLAKKLLFTWLSATIVFVMCLVVSKTILYVSTVLCNAAGAAMYLDIVLLFVIGWQAPKLVQTILTTPNKMKMSGVGPTEAIISKSSHHLSNFHKATHGTNKAHEKARSLQNQRVAENRADRTAFDAGIGSRAAAFDNAATSSSAIHNLSAQEINAFNELPLDEVATKTLGLSYAQLKETAVADLADVYSTADSETMRKMGMDETIIKAQETLENTKDKRKLKEEEREKRRAKYNEKRLKFYQRLDSKPMRILNKTRIGAYMTDMAIQFEEHRDRKLEKNDYVTHFDTAKKVAGAVRRPKQSLKAVNAKLAEAGEKHNAKKTLKVANKNLQKEGKQTISAQVTEHKAKLAQDVKEQFKQNTEKALKQAEQKKQAAEREQKKKLENIARSEARRAAIKETAPKRPNRAKLHKPNQAQKRIKG